MEPVPDPLVRVEDQRQVHRTAFQLGGDVGSDGRPVADGRNLRERPHGIGAGRQELGVLGDELSPRGAAAGGGGLEDLDRLARAAQAPRDRAGDERLADARVRASNEQAAKAGQLGPPRYIEVECGDWFFHGQKSVFMVMAC